MTATLVGCVLHVFHSFRYSWEVHHQKKFDRMCKRFKVTRTIEMRERYVLCSCAELCLLHADDEARNHRLSPSSRFLFVQHQHQHLYYRDRSPPAPLRNESSLFNHFTHFASCSHHLTTSTTETHPSLLVRQSQSAPPRLHRCSPWEPRSLRPMHSRRTIASTLVSDE